MSRMKEVRVQKNLQQVDLVKATGLSKGSISLIESGKSSPSMNSAFKIAQALDVTVDELFKVEEREEVVQ